MISLSNMLLGKASKKCAVLYLIQYEIDWFKMCWNFRSWVINSGHKQFGLREKQSREGSFLHSRSEATLCFGHVIFTFHGPCGKWDFQMKLGSVRCCQGKINIFTPFLDDFSAVYLLGAFFSVDFIADFGSCTQWQNIYFFPD